MITVNQPRENGRTTYCRQFTYNPKGEYNSRRDGAIVSGMPVEGTPILDAPLETLVRFGTIYGQPIVWRIADFNHNGYPQNSVSLFTNQIYKLACMDAKESDRTSGRNYYPWSNIRSWLNSDAGPGEWFAPMHSTDAPPNAANVKNGINTLSKNGNIPEIIPKKVSYEQFKKEGSVAMEVKHYIKECLDE